MGRGIFIMLPKQLRELGSIYVFRPGYHGNADTTNKFCRPFTLHSPYQDIVSVLSKFPPWPIDYKLFNPVTMVTANTWKKLNGKLRLYFHVIKKSCLKEIGIPFCIRLLYSFCVLFIAL